MPGFMEQMTPILPKPHMPGRLYKEPPVHVPLPRVGGAAKGGKAPKGSVDEMTETQIAQLLAYARKVLADQSSANWQEKQSLISKLAMINKPEAVQVLIGALADRWAPTVEAAVIALAGMLQEQTIPLLADALQRDVKPAVRAGAAWALGMKHDATQLPGLVRALSDKSPVVQLAAVEAIDEIGATAAEVPTLVQLLASKDATMRAAVLRALGTPGLTTAEAIVPLLRDNDPVVRATAIRALARVDPDRFVSDVLSDTKESYFPALIARLYALRLLHEEHPGNAAYSQEWLKLAVRLLDNHEWQVRARAIEELFQIRTADVITPLINRINKEKGRLQADIIGVLETLTGQPIGDNTSEWITWWKQRRDGWVPYAGTEPASAPASATVSLPTFQGLKVRSKKVVFVIDMSGSMISQHRDRIDAALKDLAKTIMGMPADAEVSVVIMNSRTPKEGGRYWSKTLLPLTGLNKIGLQNFVSRVLASLQVKGTGTGDFEDAVLDAMSLPGVDTIYVWSDGNPTASKHITPAGVLGAIARVNQYKSVKINSVITEDPDRWEKDTENMYEEFMRTLAETNSGEYVKR
jgi:HEAT repeat protein